MKQYGERGMRFHISTPKTENSIRDVPMLPEVKQAFEEQRALQRELLDSKVKEILQWMV